MPLFTVDQLPPSVVLNAVGNAADLAFDGLRGGHIPRRRRRRANISVAYDVRNLSENAGRRRLVRLALFVSGRQSSMKTTSCSAASSTRAAWPRCRPIARP